MYRIVYTKRAVKDIKYLKSAKLDDRRNCSNSINDSTIASSGASLIILQNN